MPRKRSDEPRVTGFDFTQPAASAPDAQDAFAPPAEGAAPPLGYPAYPAPGAQDAYAPPTEGSTVATVPPAYPQPGYGYPPPPPWVPGPAERKGNRAKVIALSVTAAIVGFGVIGAVTDSSDTMPGGKKIPEKVTLHTPERIGGAERLTSAFAKQVEAESLEGITSLQQPQVALYGTSSTPRYFLFAGFSPEQSSKEVFDEFKRGFVEEEGTAVGSAKAMPGNVVCGPVTIEELKGMACAWASARSNGVLVDYLKRDMTRLSKLAAQARIEVNGT